MVRRRGRPWQPIQLLTHGDTSLTFRIDAEGDGWNNVSTTAECICVCNESAG